MHVTGAECFPRPTITLSSPPGNSPLTYSKLAMANRAKCVTTAGDSKKKRGLISDEGSRRGITWRGATGQSLFPATATCEESLATRPDSGESRFSMRKSRGPGPCTLFAPCLHAPEYPTFCANLECLLKHGVAALPTAASGLPTVVAQTNHMVRKLLHRRSGLKRSLGRGKIRVRHSFLSLVSFHPLRTALCSRRTLYIVFPDLGSWPLWKL